VRRPLLQRKSFWYTVLGVAIVLLAVGIWYGISKQRAADREESLAAAKRRAAAQYQQQVEPILAGIGEPLQASAFDVLPELSAQLTAFSDGSASAKELGETASGVAEAAKGAAADLEAVDAVDIVKDKGLDEIFVLYILNSRARMTEGLQLFEQAALLAQDAAGAEGDASTALADRATAITEIASRVFADGYQDYAEAQILAGIYQPTPISP
jgi:hypothetical protein